MNKIKIIYLILIWLLFSGLNIFTTYAGPSHCFDLSTQAHQDSCIAADSKAQGFDSYVVYTYKDFLIIGLWSVILLMIIMFIYKKHLFLKKHKKIILLSLWIWGVIYLFVSRLIFEFIFSIIYK